MVCCFPFEKRCLSIIVWSSFTPFIGAPFFHPIYNDRLQKTPTVFFLFVHLVAPGDLPIEVDELQPEGPTAVSV